MFHALCLYSTIYRINFFVLVVDIISSLPHTWKGPGAFPSHRGRAPSGPSLLPERPSQSSIRQGSHTLSCSPSSPPKISGAALNHPKYQRSGSN